MVSSLEIGPRPGYAGRAVAPQGSGGAFLSVGAPAPRTGATELRDAMALAPSRVEYVSAALPPRAAVSGMGQFDVRHISEGTFTEVTIRNMHKAVLAAKTDAHWRGMMEDIRRAGRRAGAVGWKDYAGEVAWFDHWYRRVHPIDYVRDPHQVELVMHPFLVYSKALGDCLPIDQKVLLRHRATNSYVILALGEVRERFADYDAVSYAETSGRFEFAPITDWLYKGRKPVVRVRTRSGLEFRCTNDHRVFSFFRRQAGKAQRLESRRLSDLASLSTGFSGLAMAHKLPALHSTNTIPSYQLYVEGMYVAEGYSEYPSRAEISNKSKDIVATLKGCLDKLSVPYRERRRKDGVVCLYVKASYLSERLHRVFGEGSASKRFPDEYLSLSQEDLATALGAYAAGDAYIPRATKSGWEKRVNLVYNTASEELKEQLVVLHLILGKPLSVYWQRSSGGAGRNPLPMWRLIDWKLKKRTHVERLPNLENATFKVRDDGEAEVCDITVAGNHNFITAQGHLVHNCDDMSTLYTASLGALGAPHAFRTFKADPARRPGEWTHVSAVVWVPGRGWVNEDLTVKGAHPGWEPAGFETKDWPEPRW